MSTEQQADAGTASLWIASAQSVPQLTALCLGSGRFLRSVLVPSLIGMHVGLIQPRGRSMMYYMGTRTDVATYEVDTVLTDGSIETTQVPCDAVFTLGTAEGRDTLQQCLKAMKQGISVLGVGVTEAGLADKDTPVMKDLYDLLWSCCELQRDGHWPVQTICVIDMDNVPNNGSLIRSYLMELADDNQVMKDFLSQRVVLCDTMVDRITSQRPNSGGMVPQCEPMPTKALVICDPEGVVPESLRQQPGVICRTTRKQLDLDIALKLRIANGTHTAIAHALALMKHLMTDVLSRDALFMKYLDALVEHQIYQTVPQDEATIVWDDWRRRLIHPHFGLSSFFITQNGTAKGGIRWGPMVVDLLQLGVSPQMSLALAYAILLRWLTPLPVSVPSSSEGTYFGWLDGHDPQTTSVDIDASTVVEYADGMRYDLEGGWYEFKCPLSELTTQLKDCASTKSQPEDCLEAIRTYLLSDQGGNLAVVADTPGFQELSRAIAFFYARLIAGDGLYQLLQELDQAPSGIGFTTPCSALATVDAVSLSTRPLHYQPHALPDASHLMNLPVTPASLEAIVISEVTSVQAIDLHTHLLPPTHGPLCLWGIDELLTYHYLVAEYFMTAPASMTPEDFYAKNKQEQADIIWNALFLDRSPLSEACRGVLTTLMSLGLHEAVARRDLASIRQFYQSFRDRSSAGAEEFCELTMSQAGVEYAIMTNIPFDSMEARFWKPNRVDYSKRFRSALRVDPLLAGDRVMIENALKIAGYDITIEGARQYLRDWIDTIKPEYMMASTPHDFVVREGSLASKNFRKGVDEKAFMQPGAFVQFAAMDHLNSCDGAEDEAPSAIDETSDFLTEVLMKVCEERDLPIALKIGAHRGVNPRLKAAGDGVVAFADASMLARLCTRFPTVRFLATFLSRNNQHEACVLANKFRNLHIYGCWWYCNNPSIIREITSMRVEMLGTAFTAQHSDARVMDQLLYKWPHSRSIIAQVLIQEYGKVLQSGWSLTRAEIRRDVYRLFRGSYEEFMAKSLKE